MSCNSPPQRRVHFVCSHGALRSPMAAALLTAHGAEGCSAGITPSPAMNPLCLAALREIGLVLDAVRPRRLSTEDLAGCRVIWLGSSLPTALNRPGVEHWDIGDAPIGDLDAARELRRDLEGRIDGLLARLDGQEW